MRWHEWRQAPPCDYAVLGDPIHHSRSPQMHRAAYRSLDLKFNYEAVRVPLEEFDEAVEHLADIGVQGVNCTLPLKGSARRWAESRGGLTGQKIGCLPGPWSANTLNLVTEQGISTDEAGFFALLKSLATLEKPRVLLLGAGGTGQALAHAILQEAWPLSVWNRTPGKWEQILGESPKPVEIQSEISLKGVGVLVNATSSGLHDDDLPIPWDEAVPELAALDLLYGRQTAFLDQAKAHGLKAADGSLMLMEQGALSFEWWLGLAAPRSAMLEAIHADSPAH